MDRVYVMELVRAFQCGHMTRREFLRRATLAVGGVAAAQLLAACTSAPAEAPGETPSPVVVEGTAVADEIATEIAGETYEGLTVEMVEIPNEQGEPLIGYLARPTDAQDLPAVVVVQEWWGLNAHIRDVARRFANEGFIALAPDLYNGVVTSEPDEARKLAMELDMQQAVSEIGQAIAYVLEQPATAGEEAGIVGFCMGGRLVLQTVRQNENVGAVVAFYGSPLEPEEVQDVNAPVLGLYGSEDQSIPVEAVRTMEEALQEAGIEHEIQVYEGAGHAFFNNTRDSYDEEAAADAWPRTLQWFRENL
jgi:carboxymethylenebutenolidase